MDNKELLTLVGLVKSLLSTAIELAVEVRTRTGEDVITRDQLDALYNEAMRHRDWQN